MSSNETIREALETVREILPSYLQNMHECSSFPDKYRPSVTLGKSSSYIEVNAHVPSFQNGKINPILVDRVQETMLEVQHRISEGQPVNKVGDGTYEMLGISSMVMSERNGSVTFALKVPLEYAAALEMGLCRAVDVLNTGVPSPGVSKLVEADATVVAGRADEQGILKG